MPAEPEADRSDLDEQLRKISERLEASEREPLEQRLHAYTDAYDQLKQLLD